MARESEDAARLAEANRYWRSSASRYYYAAYQAITAVLLYRKLQPPEGREAWNHEITPLLLNEHLEPLIRSRDKRNDLAARLGKLRKLRITADYLCSEQVGETKVQVARRDAGYVIKVVEDILPEE